VALVVAVVVTEHSLVVLGLVVKEITVVLVFGLQTVMQTLVVVVVLVLLV
jgi:hypothetical protein